MPTDFTPVSALLGGMLIGLAATVLYAGIGRIAGISGILNSAIEQRGERGWRARQRERHPRRREGGPRRRLSLRVTERVDPVRD